MTWALLITISLGSYDVTKIVLPDFAQSRNECVRKATNIPVSWGDILKKEGIQPHIDMNCVEEPGKKL